MFALACLAKPLFCQFIKVSIWNQGRFIIESYFRHLLIRFVSAVCLAYATNEDYIRQAGLQVMVKEEYRQDVISGNLKDWLIPGREHSSKLPPAILNRTPF